MCELVFTGKTTSLTHFFHDSCLVPWCLRTTACDAYVRSRCLLGNCSCWLSSSSSICLRSTVATERLNSGSTPKHRITSGIVRVVSSSSSVLSLKLVIARRHRSSASRAFSQMSV